MIRNVFKRLNEPFPSKGGLRSSLISTFYVALFIAGFLFVFKPFGMRHAPNLLATSLAFGGVSFLCSLSFDLLCRYVLKIKTDVPSWTLWKWLAQMFLLVSWIAFGNHILQSVLFWGNFGNLKLWLEIWQATLTLGCLPVFVSGLIIQMRATQENVRQADGIDLPEKAPKQDLRVELVLGSSESIHVLARDILFVEAMQNYVQVTLIQTDRPNEAPISRHMIRNTISKTLQYFQQSGVENIIRCHRSFLVNIDQIEAVNGNAQGLRLNIVGLPDALIPVSRSYIPEFKQTLERVTHPSTM